MRKLGWIIICICLCLSLPSVFHKHDIETSSQQVEFVVDFESLFALDKAGRSDEEHLHYLLPLLKEEGVTSLSIPFLSFEFLEDRQLISFVNGFELESLWMGREEISSIDRNAHYLFLLDASLEQEIDTWFASRGNNVQKKTIASQTVYELHGYTDTFLENLRFPPLERDVQALTDKGLSLIAMVPNSRMIANQNVFRATIESWQEKDILSKVMFEGKSVYGHPNQIDELIPSFVNVPIVYLETYSSDSRQKGITDLVAHYDYNAVRSHVLHAKSLTKADYTVDVLEERVTKAVHERNNRMVYVELETSKSQTTPLESWDKWKEVMARVQENLADKGYTFGVAQPFSDQESGWVMVAKGSFIVLTATLFALLLSLYVREKWAFVGWRIGILGLFFAQWVLPSLLWMVLPFAFAVLYPVTIAGFLLKKWFPSNQGFLRSILLFMGISLLSIVFALALTGIHASIPYILYVEFFKGVGMAHLLPIVIVFVMVFLDGKTVSFSSIWNLLKQPIRFYHVAIISIVLVGAVFYLSRTGNGGILLPFETELRTFMQETFSVRPRTKEFLLAHPLLVAILYFWKGMPWVKWLLPVAIIGQLSLLNTFAHLHTPVVISLIRSLLGIGLGAVIGCIFIGAVLLLKKQIQIRMLRKENK